MYKIKIFRAYKHDQNIEGLIFVEYGKHLILLHIIQFLGFNKSYNQNLYIDITKKAFKDSIAIKVKVDC